MSARPGRSLAAALLGAGLIAALSSCATGPVDAGDITAARGPVPAHPAPVNGPAVRGRAVDNYGRVASGATVAVQVVLSQQELNDRNAKSALSLGFGCLDGTGCSTPTTIGRVAQDGNFAVAIPRGAYSAQDLLAVTVVALRGDSARVASSVRVPQRANGAVAAGVIPVPAGAPSLSLSGVTGHLVMPPLGSPTEPVNVTMSRPSQFASEGQFTVRPPATDVSGGLDERLIENSRVLLVGRQTTTWHGRSVGLSASLLTAGTVIPPSRGAACYVIGARGQHVQQAQCGLTDGDIDDMWAHQDDPRCSTGPCKGPYQRDHRDIYVVLPQPLRASLLVVHGCGGPWCKVQLSSDGHRFGGWLLPPQGEEPDATYAVHLSPGTTVRVVHVYTDTGGFFDELREVSLFR